MNGFLDNSRQAERQAPIRTRNTFLRNCAVFMMLIALEIIIIFMILLKKQLQYSFVVFFVARAFQGIVFAALGIHIAELLTMYCTMEYHYRNINCVHWSHL